MRTVADALIESVIVEGSTPLQAAWARMLDADADADAAIVVEEEPAELLTAEDVARGLAERHDAGLTPVAAIADPNPMTKRG